MSSNTKSPSNSASRGSNLERLLADPNTVDRKGILLPGEPDFVRMGKEAGNMLIEGEVQCSTLQCVHCNRQWVPIRGSGTTRGWCTNCSGPVCGAKPCVEHCAPWEKQLDIIERKARQQVWT